MSYLVSTPKPDFLTTQSVVRVAAHIYDPNFRLFGAKCCACLGVIAPTEQAHFVNGYVYHSACFTCAVCRRTLNAGDFFYMRHDMKLVCKADYDRCAHKGKHMLKTQ